MCFTASSFLLSRSFGRSRFGFKPSAIKAHADLSSASTSRSSGGPLSIKGDDAVLVAACVFVSVPISSAFEGILSKSQQVILIVRMSFQKPNDYSHAFHLFKAVLAESKIWGRHSTQADQWPAQGAVATYKFTKPKTEFSLHHFCRAQIVSVFLKI